MKVVYMLYMAIIMLLRVYAHTLAQMHACLYMHMWMPEVNIFKALFLLCRCVCTYHLSVELWRSEVFDLLELSLQIVVFYLMRVLRTQLASSLEASAHNGWNSFPFPKGRYLKFQCVCSDVYCKSDFSWSVGLPCLLLLSTKLSSWPSTLFFFRQGPSLF